MLISSMDQLNYYSMSKDSYLEIDTSAAPRVNSMSYSALGQTPIVMSPEEGSPTYLNEENSPKNGTKSSLYKTELCKRFSEFGSCRYGAKCQFAHGVAELRHVVRHPKYKTTKCKSYWGSGHCPYGSRCRFIHEESEALSHQPPYSPSGGMNGLFMHEKPVRQHPHLSSLGSNGPVLSELGVGQVGVGNNGYLYGHNGSGLVGAGDHPLTPPGSSLLSSSYSPLGLSGSFEEPSTSAWGAHAQSRLSYGAEGFGAPKQPVGLGNGRVVSGMLATGVPPPPPSGVSSPIPVNGMSSSGSSSYPDLQDAIDALMKFSLSPSDKGAAMPGDNNAETSRAPSDPSSSLGTISTSAPQDGVTKKTDYSLHADELWKDFPSLSGSSVGFGDNQWPAGLSLSLEGTGLFSDGLDSVTASSTSSLSSPAETTSSPSSAANVTVNSPSDAAKDETSPRLSIFERFH
ncbi:hypothetical protein ATCC90586_006180 [Pythium insidiosum]|nr:hypothetical protein ATCC90586_006180 [Pythium insidiosum]